ncbi:MAG: glycerol-3-phosphate dehydrogenase/oxidase [Burkholderiaceae bacterium]
MIDQDAPSRESLCARLDTRAAWDAVIVGGGATGLGIALELAMRGLRVALLEREDFAKGTSSRATKLLHGGVRYLAQGNLALVREALAERSTVIGNAPHLAQPLEFLIPLYGLCGRVRDRAFYGAGLHLYDFLAGRRNIGHARFVGPAQVREMSPGIKHEGLAGALAYWDGQFDDARLALALARTAIAEGACALNHFEVVALLREGEQACGVVAQDRESGRRHEIRARCVINATGVWVETLRRLADTDSRSIVAPSQGVHRVVAREFHPGPRAIQVPRTSDGRVLFIVPWMGKTILGTTDTPRADVPAEPAAFDDEIDFILRETANRLARAPTRTDVRSIWVGLRPLVRPAGDDVASQRVSREHTVLVARSGLVSVTGGKWTTYRAMAHDVVEHCVSAGLIDPGRPTDTAKRSLVGAPGGAGSGDAGVADEPGPHLYGADAAELDSLPGSNRAIAPGLSEAMVRFAVRREYARSVEDVLARRSRLLFLDAEAAAAVADDVASVMASELGPGFSPEASATAFRALARGYRLTDRGDSRR